MDSLKALDPRRPIREADIDQVAVTDRMGADIISTGAKLADLAARVAANDAAIERVNQIPHLRAH